MTVALKPKAPARILSGAAEGVRQFNHASLSTGADWEYPSDSYDALGNLAYLVRMLPQAIEQSIRPAVRVYEHGRLQIDGNGDADVVMERLVGLLTEALQRAEDLAETLDGMHSVTSSMGLDTTGIPDFDDEGGV